MKCVIASTNEQEKKLEELIDYIYSAIFPRYFTDQQIKEFLDLGVLQIDAEQLVRLYTLKTAFQVMSSLQVVITILEMPFAGTEMVHREKLLEKNIRNLNKCELLFPFTYQYFLNASKERTNIMLSKFVNPANKILI